MLWRLWLLWLIHSRFYKPYSCSNSTSTAAFTISGYVLSQSVSNSQTLIPPSIVASYAMLQKPSNLVPQTLSWCSVRRERHMMHACASAQTMVPTMSPPCFLHKNSTIKDLVQTCLGSYAGVIFESHNFPKQQSPSIQRELVLN